MTPKSNKLKPQVSAPGLGGFKGKPLIFFCMTVSVILGRKFAVSRVLGFENLKPMVVSLKLGILAMFEGRRPSTSPKSPSFKEYHPWFSSFHTLRTREYRKIFNQV